MKMMSRIVLAAILCSVSAWAQPVSVGVKGGLPIASVTQDSPCPFCARQNRYVAGVSVEVRLPRRLAIEADGLVRRLHATYSAFQLHTPFGISGPVSGYDWELPVLLKYKARSRKLSPFAGLGPSFRHVGTLRGTGLRTDFSLQNVPEAITFDPPKDLGIGIAAGAGVTKKLGVLRVSPEIRYTRWTEEFFQPNKNQVELLLGVHF